MSTPKTRVPVSQTIREDIKMLAQDADAAVSVPDVSKSEFWTMLGGVLTNLVTVAVLIGWLDSTNAETVTRAVTAVLAASEALIVNGLLVWKYLAGRATLRAQLVDSRYRYLETVAIERMRLESKTA